ncbi:protein EPIDERMAL PATTERNING FACTOR 2-like [Zingiber officinale]|uniref:protein EPIDERMAL PATTERNING FACTOR 2-like n=1 Tax=Zingiber officinale TaxID=94328 RepID=UPI001C4DC82B|nr:protein EPIDERMAL PATTERNING FACTOR 2-like [Zingiber officinale]
MNKQYCSSTIPFLLLFLFTALFLLTATMAQGFRPSSSDAANSSSNSISKEMYVASGSSLPDCTHACGPCFPCKRVMVSFKCSIADSCPVVYRCMCNGRYYHVPSKLGRRL